MVSDAVIITALQQAPGIIAALASIITVFMVSRQHAVINNLERNTNSMSDALVKVTGESEFAKGKVEGKADILAAIPAIVQRQEKDQK